MADIREILVQWDAGEDLSHIARALGYSRLTVRKYVQAAARLGLSPDQRRRDEPEREALAAAAVAHVAQQRPPGPSRVTGVLREAALPESFPCAAALRGDATSRWLILAGFVVLGGTLAVGLQRLKDRR